MFVNIREIQIEKYDVIVAGSGLAAYALVKRLARGGKSALILESGMLEYDGTLQEDFTTMFGRGHFDAQYWPLHWGRMLGGTSAFWAGWCTPLTERNFRDWPISRKDLDPYYLLAAGYLRRTDAFLTYDKPFVPGFDYRPLSAEPALNLNSEPDLLEELSLADIALTTTLKELHPSDDRRSIDAISIYTPDGPDMLVKLREGQTVVLAAGGVGNAQILLSSSSESGQAVGNEEDQVGRYLMEHPHFYNCARILASADHILPKLPEDFGIAIPAVAPDDALYDQLGSIDLSIELLDSDVDLDDPVERFLVGNFTTPPIAYELNVRSEMPPEAENRLKVAEGHDPAGLRRLRAICYIGTDTFRAVDSALEFLSDTLVEAGPSRLAIRNEEIARNVTGGGHTMGTTRMGDSPRTSVVDRDCRVHGYGNLFVAGSSVFTSGGYANPTLTLMALAARLGDKISGTS
ncbi:GMC oxidoreductase [Roseibium sediminicola]|uniref:GMC oxidoreductase n=1 Tax=Roseibium sediminicola TaxID=2933272 RepID=A0ABT0H383_9HYPH|nr:GMC oxidoreductase [Roseibium sp. CAU 1639]MCK7615565.1 GMC oxidoreductase [Roseibium sp. CAU 1639]